MTEAAGCEELDHTADVALRVWGPDLRSLLCQAAWGMNRLMAGAKVPASDMLPVTREVVVEAFDRESLLVEWLSALALSAETECILFYDFDFRQLTDVRLEAVLRGVPAPALKSQVKAVTYHNLAVTATARGMEATVTFDV